MDDVIEIGQPPIPVKLRRNVRARRYSLRISNRDGTVSLTLPSRGSLREAEAFAASHEGWLRRHLSRQTPKVPVSLGGHILLDGQKVGLAAGQGRSVQFDGETLYVPGREDQLSAKLRGYFKTLARERFVSASEHYAAMLDRSIGAVTLRDTKSRWGSCTSDGNLMYSWRLIMAPREVQNYVAAHEVCHLEELNHSPAYWALVEQIFPDYKSQRQWLKRNGAMLHSYLI